MCFPIISTIIINFSYDLSKYKTKYNRTLDKNPPKADDKLSWIVLLFKNISNSELGLFYLATLLYDFE